MLATDMCDTHEFLPFSSKKERKKLSLRYDDANTRKIVMATVEFIYITSNTFILQSHFYTHMYVTHRISGLYAALVAAVAMAVTAVQLFYIQMHTYNTPRVLSVRPHEHTVEHRAMNK